MPSSVTNASARNSIPFIVRSIGAVAVRLFGKSGRMQGVLVADIDDHRFQQWVLGIVI